MFSKNDKMGNKYGRISDLHFRPHTPLNFARKNGTTVFRDSFHVDTLDCQFQCFLD